MINLQPIEKLSKNNSDLEVHSIFETIQGEGPFCGVPCVFVRLSGCNLQCPACDTEYTSSRVLMSPNTVVGHVESLRPNGLVVITGGEPFRQPVALTRLLEELVGAGYYVQIETNGTLPAPSLDEVEYNTDPVQKHGVYVVCSPKTHQVQESVQQVAFAYKYVMSASSVDPADGLPVQVLDHPVVGRVWRPYWHDFQNDTLIYLQPAEAGTPFISEMNLTACVESCMKHGYTLQLQIHKLIGVA